MCRFRHRRAGSSHLPDCNAVHYYVGFVGSMAGAGYSVAIYYNGLVYDVATYLAGPPVIMSSAGTQPPSGIDVNFMSGDILDLFQLYGGTNITKRLNSLRIDRNVLSWQETCL
jgi:chitin synthase